MITRFLAAIAAMFVIAAPATAARAETWVLALSWQPQFCETRPEKRECDRITPGTYAAANLVLHGLWPPENYCGVSKMHRGIDKPNTWDKLPKVTLSPALAAELKEVMPGVDSHLDRHEWIKHGTCSGLTQEAYFRLAVDLAKQASRMKFDDLIGSRAGASMTRDELCNSFAADFGAPHAKAIKVDPPGGGSLQEIQIRLRVEEGRTALTGDKLADGATLRCGNKKITVDAAN